MLRSRSYLAKYPKTEYFIHTITKRTMDMRVLLISLGALMMTGCANIGTKQSACEQQYEKFAEIVSCTKGAIDENRKWKNDAQAKYYVLRGEQLVEEIRGGKITELDARTEWQKLFVELKQNEEMAGGARAAAYNATRPRQTNCRMVGNYMQCNSY
jgi:uncharacterized lipoprotein YajG